MAEPELEEEMASASCEIGSLEMPSADWMFAAAASVQHSYGQVHPYLAAGLCVAGTLMNLVTVLVLTRPSMRSPVNVLLCAVACCDIVVEGSYLVFVLHFLLASAQRCEPADFSWGWALFMMFHAHASVIFHAASIWMTVSLAQIRVFTIRRATNGPGTPLITERFTAVLALFTTLAMAMVNLPNFLTFEIMEVPASAMLSCWQPPASTELPTTSLSLSTRSPELLAEKLQNFTTANGLGQSIEQLIENGSSHLISTLSPLLLGMGQLNRTRRHRLKRFRRDIGDIGSSTDQPSHWEMPAIEEPMVYTVRAHESDCMKLKLAFWSNGMIFKVIPCLLLTLSIVALLRIIADVAHKRKKLAQVMRKKVPKDHTTPMLVAILLIFLLTELPQGVCLVLNGIFSSESFHKRVYLPLGDLMDLLSLLNSAVGFLIYVGMSRKFRTVLLQLLFDTISCFLSKTPCAPGVPTNGGGESTGGGASTSKNWRRTSASCTAQHLLHSNGFQQQHSPERPSSSGTAANLLSKRGRDTGGGRRIKNKRAAQQSSSSSRKGKRAHKLGSSWMRWRPILLSSGGGQPTELTNRTEQLSLCPSSLLGLPSLTLAVSCSAGITAAAASVGVQLLHLDPPSGAYDQKQAHKRLPSSASCNLLLLAPPNLPNCFANRYEPFRRLSSENQLRDQHLGLLNIPQPNCSASADLLQVADTKRASFLSLGDDQPTAADGRQRPPKRISFNLPPLDEHQRLAAEADAVERRRSMGPTGSDKNAGFGQRLRRSFLLSLGHRKGHSQHDGLSMMVGNAEFGGEEAEVQLGTPTQSNGIMAQNGHCFVAVANADSSNVNCPGKALLKLQSQGQGNQGQGNCGSSGKSTFSSSALARALMTTLLGRQTAEESSATMRRRQSATGSAGSPQRRLCALRAETNFVGWAAYC